MRCFATPEATCQAVCHTCSIKAPQEQWAAWQELDPATLAGLEPLRCVACGTPLDY